MQLNLRVLSSSPTLGMEPPLKKMWVVCLFFVLKIYVFIHDRHREREAETQAEGEAGSLQEPNAGLDPGSGIPGSHPEPKAEAQQLSHPDIQNKKTKKNFKKESKRKEIANGSLNDRELRSAELG